MVSIVTLVVWWQLASASASCSATELKAMQGAEQALAQGDAPAALAALDREPEGCQLKHVSVLSLRAWAEARALASAGGPFERQGAVRRALAALDALASSGELALEAEYAATCIRAALAAAQDERPEMELLLTHARDLSERLLVRKRRALWPRPLNEAAGELWFEVDRYADAALAYARALSVDPSPVARVGLARALARDGRMDEACATYRLVTGAAPALRAAAAVDLARCP